MQGWPSCYDLPSININLPTLEQSVLTDIEDSADLFVVKFHYNLLIHTLFLRKVPMVSTKSRLWLDTTKKV